MNEYDGPIDVSGNITPISKQPVGLVNAARWETMSLTLLLEQRMILETRRMWALESGQPGIAKQIEEFGLKLIDTIIYKKDDDISIS